MSSPIDDHIGHRATVTTGPGYEIVRCEDCGITDELHHMDEARPLRVREIARVFDVPLWLITTARRPRFARLRWRLRKAWPIR